MNSNNRAISFGRRRQTGEKSKAGKNQVPCIVGFCTAESDKAGSDRGGHEGGCSHNIQNS